MSLKEKQVAIQGFKDASRDYGLDLRRMSMMASQGSLWDDGCLLICASDKQGLSPRLFNPDGSPSEEVLEEVSRPRSATTRRDRHG